MAMKPFRPCRHPGCSALTREGYCPKHKPARAPRRASAEYHSWYSLPIWTEDLRPAQLLREPRVRRAVSARRPQAPHQGHGGGPHRASPGQLGQVHRPGQPPEPVQAPSRPENGPGTGRKTAGKWPLIEADDAGKRGDAWAQAPGRGRPWARPGRPKASAPPPGVRKF